MKMTTRWMALSMLLSAATLACGADLDSIQKQLQAAWSKHKTMSAKLTISGHMEMAGMSMDTKGDGTIELLRDGDSARSRTELKIAMIQKQGDQENKMEQTVLSITDGEFAHTLTDMGGQKRAMKGPVTAQMTGEPKAMFAELQKDLTLKVLPEEKVDGKKVYMIEAAFKEKPPMGPTKLVMTFDQEMGVLVKFAQLTDDDKPMQTMTFSDFKFDEKIDPDRFKFKLPEGVQETDMSALGKPAKDDQPATKKSDTPEKKADEPKQPDKPEKP